MLGRRCSVLRDSTDSYRCAVAYGHLLMHRLSITARCELVVITERCNAATLRAPLSACDTSMRAIHSDLTESQADKATRHPS